MNPEFVDVVDKSVKILKACGLRITGCTDDDTVPDYSKILKLALEIEVLCQAKLFADEETPTQALPENEEEFTCKETGETFVAIKATPTNTFGCGTCCFRDSENKHHITCMQVMGLFLGKSSCASKGIVTWREK
jgi:hypothetical protein